MTMRLNRQARRILFVGTTGSGKSSIINLLTNESHAISVGNDSMGTTRSYFAYPWDEDGIAFDFIDTTGLNEASCGAVPSKQQRS
jgi:small GTP-binding protein